MTDQQNRQDEKEKRAEMQETDPNDIPYGEWVSGEELAKMMENLGITRADLKPLVISFDDEVISWLERFHSRMREEPLRESLARSGLDGDKVAAHFQKRAAYFMTKNRGVEFKSATDVTGRAVYEHPVTVNFADFCLDLFFDALEFAYSEH